MAIDDAYATAAQYKARVEMTGSGSDTEINAILKSVSRWIERRTQRVFNQSAASTARYFSGEGYSRIYVNDFVAIDSGGLVVDEDSDGTFERTVSAANMILWPYNAAELSRPYRAIDLAPFASNNELYTFPLGGRNVKITGTFGWPVVPPEVVEATCLLAREVRDLQQAGPTLTVENIDAAIRLSPRAPAIIQEYLAALCLAEFSAV